MESYSTTDGQAGQPAEIDLMLDDLQSEFPQENGIYILHNNYST